MIYNNDPMTFIRVGTLVTLNYRPITEVYTVVSEILYDVRAKRSYVCLTIPGAISSAYVDSCTIVA
jgi:hypothetical protein